MTRPEQPFDLALAAGLVAMTTACSSSADPPACLEAPPSLECRSDFAPSYEEIFDRVLVRTCATSGASCHGPEGAKGGLVFADASDAYDRLLGRADGRQRVVPGDSACSAIVVRLESPEEAWGMPPGGVPIPAGQRCAIRQWIAEGATR